MTAATVALRPVSIPLRDNAGEVVGDAGVRLVLTAPEAHPDPRAWAITHQLGSVAGGTHTEVVIAEGIDLDERHADDLVRAVAAAVYPGGWAFHYRPERVDDSVRRHGSRLRERLVVVEVTRW